MSLSHKLPILYEDDVMIAVNKPSGLLSIPDRLGKATSVKGLLEKRFGSIYTVHRIDKDTGGILLFAKNTETHKQLNELFQNRGIKKFYVALLHGNIQPQTGVIEAAIDKHPTISHKVILHHKGKHAKTIYEVLEQNKHFSLVNFELVTGRQHQLRIHSQLLGSSILADPLYGDGKSVYLSNYKKNYKQSKHVEELPIIDRLALHAYQLFIPAGSLPHLNDELLIQAPVPKSFSVLLKQTS